MTEPHRCDNCDGIDPASCVNAPTRRGLLRNLTREAVDAGTYGEPAPDGDRTCDGPMCACGTEPDMPVQQCGASARIRVGALPCIGPCVLRAGHDGPVHQDVDGVQWADLGPATAEDSAGLCPPDPHPYVHLTYGPWEPSGHQCGDIRQGGCDDPVPERKVTASVGGVGEEHLVGWEFSDCPSCGPASALRDQLAEVLREKFHWWITAEWICCEPLAKGHKLCKKGHAARKAVAALLADDPEAWPPTSPILDAVLPVVEAALAEQRQRAEQAERERDDARAELDKAVQGAALAINLAGRQAADDRTRAEQAEDAVQRARAFFEDMRTWCSPHGVAADYAKRGLEALDQPEATP